MLIENASAELALLLFTLLMPVGLMALAALAYVRGVSSESGEDIDKKMNRLTTIPACIMIVGLICAFFHLGHPTTVFFMLSGIGSSPLSNEILVAAIAILIGVIYWIMCLVKGMPAATHKVFGIVLFIVALICAIFTGIAYSIPTIPTWDTAYNWIGQIGLALLGGLSLAAAVLKTANYSVKDQLCRVSKVVGAVGLLLVAITLIGQGAGAGSIMGSLGTLPAAVLSEYATFGIASMILCAAGYALWLCGKDKPVMLWVAFICILIGLAIMRIDFYGIYFSAGLAMI